MTKKLGGGGGGGGLDTLTYPQILPGRSILNMFPQKTNQRLGFLRKTKSLLPHIARFHFYNRLILPNFDYDGIVWGDKDNAVLMNNLQLLQNKAAKTILNRPFHSSATNALEALEWLTSEKISELQRDSNPWRLCVSNLHSSIG